MSTIAIACLLIVFVIVVLSVYSIIENIIFASKDDPHKITAFEEYEREVLEQLEKDKKEFLSYLEKLREREDRKVFNQFQTQKSEQAR